jgi:hypothetical protein
MLYVILYFKLRNFVISQFGIRNIGQSVWVAPPNNNTTVLLIQILYY